MKNAALERIVDLSRRDEAVRIMIRVFCDTHGASSAGHLYDVDREAFNELCEAAESLVDQLGDAPE